MTVKRPLKTKHDKVGAQLRITNNQGRHPATKHAGICSRVKAGAFFDDVIYEPSQVLQSLQAFFQKHASTVIERALISRNKFSKGTCSPWRGHTTITWPKTGTFRKKKKKKKRGSQPFTATLSSSGNALYQ